MMQHMTPNANPGMMMPGMEAFTLFWIASGVLLCLLAIAGILFFARWQRHRRMFVAQSIAQPKDAFADYQQGYQAQQAAPETYEEGGQSYPYPQDEQRQAKMMPVQQ
jgi:hypothetical protein